jgi:hypothetical protein
VISSRIPTISSHGASPGSEHSRKMEVYINPVIKTPSTSLRIVLCFCMVVLQSGHHENTVLP